MTQKIRRAAKYVFKFFLACIFVLGLAVLSFFFDSGRNALLKLSEKYFAMQDTVFVIKGLDAGITKIQEIFIKSPNGLELTFFGVKFERSSIFDRSSVRVEKFVLNVEKFVLNGAKRKADLDQKLKELVPLMKILRIFLAGLSLGKGILNIAGKTYLLTDLRYASMKCIDHLYSKIDQKHELDMFFMWEKSRCHHSKINFRNFFDFDGSLLIRGPEDDISTYKLEASRDDLNIKASGSYGNFIYDVAITDALLKYREKNLNFSGNLYLEDQRADLKVLANLDDFAKDIPLAVCDDFKNVMSVLDIKCDFHNDFTGSIGATFLRSQEKIGELSGNFQNGDLEIGGSVNWLQIYGFALEKMQCRFKNSKDFFLDVSGENFDLTAQAKIDEKILVEKVKMTTSNGDHITATAPFELSKTSPYSFKFCFSHLDFFNKIIDISGDCSGKINSGKDGISIDVSGKNIIYNGWRFGNVNLSLAKELLNLSAAINKDFLLSASGKCQDFCRRISLKTCALKSDEITGSCSVCDLDFINNTHKISFQLRNKKGIRTGSIDVANNNNLIDVKISSFNTSWMRKLFNGGMVAMVLDGSMRLEPRDGFLLGNGNFSVFTPITKKDMINLRLNLLADGIDLKAVVKRRQQELICEVFLPLLQGAGSKVQKNMLSNALRCRIYGSMELKDLLELTDKLDIRGSVNCDMRIGGSMANPVVHGNLTVRKARIAVNDMILKNGTISLSGNNGNNLTMVGEFIDSSKNKLTLSGGGKFIFNDFVPNVETDLQLRFGNYKLFDTDNISIVVSGIGKIAGTIENLQIGGDVVIPRCKIQKFDADDACKKDDIIIENEIRVKRKSDQKETDQKNFFRYDIKAHCPQINFSGNVFEMTLQGNLHISTYDHQQTMAGRLKIMKGKLDLFGKRMEMINGYAEFLPEFQFDPKMKFVCTRNFGDIVVYFDMENTPERGVSFDLYSTPNYSKDVILSNMLFGKDLKYLSVSEAAQMAHVLASFNSHGYIFSVLNTFQNIGIIDSLSFTSSDKRTHSLNVDKSSSSENGVNVSAGKYVNDNVYISINKTSEGATFDVDLSLTPKISVKANTAGEAGISWKYRY